MSGDSESTRQHYLRFLVKNSWRVESACRFCADIEDATGGSKRVLFQIIFT